MAGAEDWEADPGVQRMRRIFGRMEEGQKDILSPLGIDPHDPRLRGWREKALSQFERCWRIAARKGVKMTEERTAVVYLHCLAMQMALDGIQVDPGLLGGDHEIKALVKEAAR